VSTRRELDKKKPPIRRGWRLSTDACIEARELDRRAWQHRVRLVAHDALHDRLRGLSRPRQCLGSQRLRHQKESTDDQTPPRPCPGARSSNWHVERSHYAIRPRSLPPPRGSRDRRQRELMIVGVTEIHEVAEHA